MAHSGATLRGTLRRISVSLMHKHRKLSQDFMSCILTFLGYKGWARCALHRHRHLRLSRACTMPPLTARRVITKLASRQPLILRCRSMSPVEPRLPTSQKTVCFYLGLRGTYAQCHIRPICERPQACECSSGRQSPCPLCKASILT